MNLLDIVQAKLLRGYIIKRLYDMYGMPITVADLKGLLRYKQIYHEDDIARALKYLSGKEKEFIVIDIDNDSYLRSFVELTPKGVNLAEADIDDMGVTINE